jgi:hypothetical protein
LTPQQAAALSKNPSALVSTEAQHSISPRALTTLQEALARSIRTVFATSAVLCAIALVFALLLPAGRPAAAEDGEKFVMAEMTVLDAEQEPESEPSSP